MKTATIYNASLTTLLLLTLLLLLRLLLLLLSLLLRLLLLLRGFGARHTSLLRSRWLLNVSRLLRCRCHSNCSHMWMLLDLINLYNRNYSFNVHICITFPQ